MKKKHITYTLYEIVYTDKIITDWFTDIEYAGIKRRKDWKNVVAKKILAKTEIVLSFRP